MFKQNYIKDKNYLLLFFGNLVSGVGSRLHGFGISLFLLDLTGKAGSVATYIALWSFIIFVMGPIAATYTDRWKNKVKVLYMTDFGRGVSYFICAMGVLFFTNINQPDIALIVIYISLFFTAVQTAFFAPAVSALVPQIVEGEELVSAGSVMQITRSIQNLAGLFLGAILYIQFGIVMLMIINAISFVLSAISEMFIKINVPKNIDRINAGAKAIQVHPVYSKNKVWNELQIIYHDLIDAAKYILFDAKPILMITIIILISATLTSPWFAIGVPFMIKEYFNFEIFKPEYLLASSEFVESMGVIIMSLIVAQIATKFKMYQLLRIGGGLFSCMGILYFLVIYGFDNSFYGENLFIIFFIGLNFIAGMINATINAPLNASMQKYIDPNKIGKVVMMVDSFGGVLFPLTALFAGFLIDGYSMYYPLMMMMLAMFMITLIAFRSKELKKLT